MLQRLFPPRPAKNAGKALYASAAGQARDPAFYVQMGASDTGEGRFEVYSLHVALLLLRLRGQGPAATETAQALFDVYVRALDDALREMGVGDLVVGKRMRKLGEAIYGRMRSLDEALASAAASPDLEALMRRTVLEGRETGDPVALAGYARRTAAALAAQPLEELLAGRVSWPQVQA